jgi:hypothetical protein
LGMRVSRGGYGRHRSRRQGLSSRRRFSVRPRSRSKKRRPSSWSSTRAPRSPGPIANWLDFWRARASRFFSPSTRWTPTSRIRLLGEFHSLGMRNMFPISAEHGRGIDDLLDAILLVLPAAPKATTEGTEVTGESTEEGSPTPEEPHEIKVAIIGHPNVGKSTLLNQLTGTIAPSSRPLRAPRAIPSTKSSSTKAARFAS